MPPLFLSNKHLDVPWYIASVSRGRFFYGLVLAPFLLNGPLLSTGVPISRLYWMRLCILFSFPPTCAPLPCMLSHVPYISSHMPSLILPPSFPAFKFDEYNSGWAYRKAIPSDSKITAVAIAYFVGLFFKKKTTYPAEQDRPDVQEKRTRVQEEIKSINIENLIPLDECSINLAYTRLYGRAKTNERIKEGVGDARFERKSILSTIRLNGAMCPLVFEGTLNRFIFADYIRSCLKPTLSPQDVLLLDNSSVHRSKLVIDTLKECGI